MSACPVISLVLHAHMPFVDHSEEPNMPEEWKFFEALSETWLPLLETLDRLERDHIPFRLGVSLSPILCHMLSDDQLLARYLQFTDKQMEFGEQEMERTGENGELRRLARYYYDRIVEKRVLFTGRYGGNILKALRCYQQKGKLELLVTAATHAFLPFYTAYAETIQAQLEVAIASYRSHFGKLPQGFWLPELGWSGELETHLRAYNFGYTIVDTHGLVFGRPHAEKGSFYPARTPRGIFVLGRDFYALKDLDLLVRDPVYRDRSRDAGYELPLEQVKPFLCVNDGRTCTGYKYWTGGKDNTPYDPDQARLSAREGASAFLERLVRHLTTAGEYMNFPPVSLLALPIDSFGRSWYEGPEFIETLFREGSRRRDLQFMTPAEYIYKQDSETFQTLVPGFSSWGANGYGEMWLDSSNDWMYRHTMRALERMMEIAERFPNNTGLKERTLNQAAREILLVLSSDWSKMLYKQEHSEYARDKIESGLRNFTTIYEALGSNYISTEWLTGLEKRHNIFPHINYRVFRRKR
jgi:1,4-alpha-glucan branching enzyme